MKSDSEGKKIMSSADIDFELDDIDIKSYVGEAQPFILQAYNGLFLSNTSQLYFVFTQVLIIKHVFKRGFPPFFYTCIYNL